MLFEDGHDKSLVAHYFVNCWCEKPLFLALPDSTLPSSLFHMHEEFFVMFFVGLTAILTAVLAELKGATLQDD